MAFYAGQIIKHPAMENPTIVVITDRNDLDDQLFGTLSMCKDLLRQTPQQADSHADLFKMLDRPSGGVIFTTIQKFSPEDGDPDGSLTSRRNVVVIADEAHCSQYGFKPDSGCVNRVFRDKPAGRVVDYIDIAQRLKNALRQYSTPDQENTGVDEAQAVAVMMEKYEIVRAMYRPDTPNGLDYRRAVVREATPQERLGIMAAAIDWILTMQQQDVARETTDEGKKRAHRRYGDAVLALSKAYALAAASDLAREIREEVGFFQAVRAAMRAGDGEEKPRF